MTREKTAGQMAAGRFLQVVAAGAVGLPVLLLGCGGGAPEPAPTGEPTEAVVAPAAVPEPEVVIDPLTPEATDEEIVDHLLAIEGQGAVSVELSRHLPNLDRARAYRLQRMRRDRKTPADPQVGWKIGWSRQTDPRVAIDPVFGHILRSNIYTPGRPVSTAGFVGGEALVEAEVAVWLGQDLPGPDVTRDDVMAAITEVGGVIELLNPRIGPDGDGPNTHDHGIADNVFHIGVMLGEQRAAPADVDWPAERVVVEIDGEARGEGRLSSVMGRDPIAGVVWLANELLAYGEQLRAGEFVITGTVVAPPPVAAGGSARLTFTTLGTVELVVE